MTPSPFFPLFFSPLLNPTQLNSAQFNFALINSLLPLQAEKLLEFRFTLSSFVAGCPRHHLRKVQSPDYVPNHLSVRVCPEFFLFFIFYLCYSIPKPIFISTLNFLFFILLLLSLFFFFGNFSSLHLFLGFLATTLPSSFSSSFIQLHSMVLWVVLTLHQYQIHPQLSLQPNFFIFWKTKKINNKRK